ncbi:ATP12 family chaperone protein [Tateyamaria pelophila]|uniref:ATP12 family chaperone protein n=1 Tax=Tateyamaria pelophila TaxID=328415 RepID=UPI001CC1731B|nr:ATP12 family protein [Tateyamaria pelophila]
MSEWKAKRFWKAAETEQVEDGWTVRLDGRAVKTPAKAALVVPTVALADAIAAEWDAQDDVIDPLSMPFTRTANAAIDKVAPQHAEVVDMLAAYGDADLLCYRAAAPTELVLRQAAVWDPYLDWAADALGARLHPRIGLMHEPQDEAALKTLWHHTHALSAYELACFHDLVSLTGSLVLGFATAQADASANEIWSASRLDETWQEEQWGVDEEAQEAAEVKKSSYFHAKNFLEAMRER